MAISPELVKKVRYFFDLNIYETKVWLALLTKGSATAAEIADLSGVPRSRTYDVLESLEKKGFAISKIGKPVKYLAVKPDVVVDKMKNELLMRAQERVKNLSRLKETQEYAELESLYKQGVEPIKHEDVSTAIRGKLNIYSQIKAMLDNAEREVIICLSAQEFESKSRFFANKLKNLREGGIKLIIALKGEESKIKKINAKYGIKAIKTDLNSRFFVVDRKEMLFMIHPEKNNDHYDIAIWLNSRFFVEAFATLFDVAHKKN